MGFRAVHTSGRSRRSGIVGVLLVALVVSVLPPVATQATATQLCADAPSGIFSDTHGNTHAAAIDCVAWYGIARGSGDGTYLPRASVRRDQMATFLSRLYAVAGGTLPEVDAHDFVDIAGSVHEGAIAQLNALDIARGVSADRFEPAAEVRRDQMASFLVRTVETLTGQPLATGDSGFVDIDASVHLESIQKVAAAGITLGATPDRYEPARSVTRDQMATFLLRTLALLDGVEPVPAPDPADDPDPDDPDPDDDPAGDGEVELASNARVLSADEVGSITSYDPTSGQLRFPETAAPDELLANQILIGDVGPATPLGILVRVMNVTTEGGEVLVETVPASLPQAFERLDLEERLVLDPSTISDTDLLPGVTVTAVDAQTVSLAEAQATTSAFEVASFSVGITDPTDPSAPLGIDLTGNGDDDVLLSGGVSFTAALDVDLVVRGTSTESATFALDLDQNASFTASYPIDQQFDVDTDLADISLLPVTILAGPVPVVIQPQLVLSVRADGTLTGELRTSAEQQTSVRLGATYADGAWSTFGEHDLSASVEPPDLVGNLEGRASVGAELRAAVRIYGRDGPYLAASGGADAQMLIGREAGLQWIVCSDLRLSGALEVDLGVLGTVGFGQRDFLRDQRTLLRSSGAPDGEGCPAILYDNGMVAYHRIIDASRVGIFWAHEVRTVNADGSDDRRLLRNPVASILTTPAWSPDGTRIAYADGGGGTRQIYVANADGSNRQLVTPPIASFRGDLSQPSWSPDGSTLVFRRTVANPRGDDWSGLYEIAADGSDTPTRVPEALGNAFDPVFSPDGRQIAWRTGSQIYVVDRDGSNFRTVYTPPGPRDPDFRMIAPGLAWHPSDDRLLFTTTEDSEVVASCPGETPVPHQLRRMWTVDLDGENLHPVTPLPAVLGRQPGEARWSPDGERIVFVEESRVCGDFSRYERAFNITVMREDRTARRQLTNIRAGDDSNAVGSPSWQPCSAQAQCRSGG